MNGLNGQLRTMRLFNSGEKLLLIILLLSFMDFKLYSLHLMLIAFLYCCLLNGRLSIVNSIVPPLAFTIFLFIFWDANVLSPTVWVKRLVWPAAFVLGYNIVQPKPGEENSIFVVEKRAQICFFVAAFGFFIHLLLNILINSGQEIIDRNTIDFWSKARRAATGQGGIMTIPMAWCVAAIMQEKSLKKRLLAIAAICIMIYYNLTLGTRSVIVVLAVLLATAIPFSLNAGKANQRRWKILLAVAGCAMVLIFLYQNNVWNLRYTLESSILGERFLERDSFVRSDSRWARKQDFLRLMLRYPFGGKHLRRITGGYAHDVLLDTYDETSVFGAIAIVALLWDALSKMIRCLKSKRITFNTKVMVLCIYVATFCIFLVEPIFAGMPWLLMTFCFMHGIITCLTREDIVAAVSERMAN